MTTNMLAFIIILSALFFGAVEIWSSTIILFAVFSLGLFWVLRRGYAFHGAARSEKLLILIGLVFLMYVFAQAVPLPAPLLKLLSPGAFRMHHYYSLDNQRLASISLYPHRTIMGFLNILAFFMVFVLSLYRSKDTDDLTRMISVLVVFGFSLSMFGIVQKATWNDKIYWYRELTLGGAPFGPFVNRNHFAGFIGMIIPLGLGLTFAGGSREKKILFGFLTVIMSVALFFSLSRGGIVSFLAGVALFSLFMIKSRIQAKRVWIIGSFLIILLCYLLYLGISPVIERFYTTDISGEQRLIVWTTAFKAFKDFWLTGSGIGTFTNIFPLYSPGEIRNVYDHAHNDYLEFILEAGSIGVALLAVFILLLIHSVTKSGLEGRAAIFKAAAVSSAFSMAVHSIFDFNLHILSNALLFAFVLGVVAARPQVTGAMKKDRRMYSESAGKRPAPESMMSALAVEDTRDEREVEEWEREL